MTESIGTYYVDIRPNAEGFITRLREQTAQAGDESGRAFGDHFSRAARDRITAGLRGMPDARVGADTSAAQRQLDELRARIAANSATLRVNVDKQSAAQVSLLRDAILLLGPAAVPIGAAVAGALAGITPVAAAVILGVQGISKELKSGQLAGTQYGADFASVRTELTQLQQTAAAGLLPGIDEAIRRSRGEFGQFNTLIGTTSSQVGQIAAGAVPALIGVLNQLSPLFTTIGNDLAAGAQKFDDWAQSSDSISTFVAYVQTELPQVEHTLGELLTTVGHLTIGFAPFGGVVVRALGLASTAINAIPIDILSKLETVLLSGYAAWRTYSGVTALITTINAAYTRYVASFAAGTAQVEASALAEQATVAQASAAEAQARADVAAEYAAAQAQIAGTLAGTGSVFEAEAAAAATASAEEATAFQAAADAALASSAEIQAAADAAAEAVAGAGGAASAGWAGLLGPLAAVAVGVTLLSTALSGSDDAGRQNKQIMDGYAQSLQQNANALAQVNIQQTSKNLSDQGALQLLDQLNQSVSGLGINYGDLGLAVNGTEKQFDSLYTKLIQVVNANSDLHGTSVENLLDVSHLSAAQIEGNYTMNANGKAALDLALKLKQLRGDMTAQMKIQAALNQVQRQSQLVIDGGASAAARQARQFGVTTTAYLDEQVAAKKSTDQTARQTLAFQLENDAASLLQQTLDRLAGRTLSTAEAQTALRQANLQVQQAIKDNGVAIDGGTAKAVANQQAFQGQARAAIAYAEAVGKATGSSKAEVTQLRSSRDALEANLRAHGKLTPALKSYIDNLYSLSKLHVPPTKLDVDRAPADRQIHTLQAEINAIRQGRLPGVSADSKAGKQIIADLQSRIDHLRQTHKPYIDVVDSAALTKLINLENHWNALHDKTITLTVTPRGPIVSSGGNVYLPGQPHASGGTVVGPGGPKSDSVPALLSPGEEVIQEPYASRNRALLKAINAGAEIFRLASGGTAGGSSHAADLSTVSTDIHQLWLALFQSTKQLASAEDELAKAADRAGASDEVLKKLAGERSALLQDSALLARTTSQVQTAQQHLQGLQQQYASLKSTVEQASDRFDITTAGVRTPLFGDRAAAAPTFASILADKTGAANQSKVFDKELEQLQKKGLNQADFTALATGDPAQEAAQLKVLSGLSKSQIAKLNEQQKRINYWGWKAGTSSADYSFGGQIDAAQTTLGSLQAEKGKLQDVMRALADAMADQLRRDFGIPSKPGPAGAAIVKAEFHNVLDARDLYHQFEIWAYHHAQAGALSGSG